MNNRDQPGYLFHIRPQISLDEPKHVLGQRCIIHTGIWGMDFYKALYDFIIGGKMDPDGDPMRIRYFYDGIMSDIVRAMGLPEPQAMRLLRQLPAKDTLDTLGWMADTQEQLEEIIDLVQRWVEFMYHKVLFTQVDTSGNVLYIPDQIGLDYLAVTEVKPAYTHTNKSMHWLNPPLRFYRGIAEMIKQDGQSTTAPTPQLGKQDGDYYVFPVDLSKGPTYYG
jgi:hypothetical protein